MTGSRARHSLVVAAVYDLIRDTTRGTGPGFVLGDGASFILSHDPPTVRVLDVAYLSRERVPDTGIPDGFWPIAPDLAVEIISPIDWGRAGKGRPVPGSRNASGLGAAVTGAHGDRLSARCAPPIERGATDTLDGGDILPGFSVQVSALFEIQS
ncbi:MAG: Uma2 family endonuclease [Chloroflexota bacterium]|nr:Uma2 family endonuclease [Chloroflexota bacterium]